MTAPLAYFLTWTTYGTWLHGDSRGSVDDEHHARGTDYLAPDRVLERRRGLKLSASPVLLDRRMRELVELAIRTHATLRDWSIHALNVRSNHVHVVLTANSHGPEQVMSQLKSWSTRHLRERCELDHAQRIWTKMGSTRWINDDASLLAVVDYVLNHQ